MLEMQVEIDLVPGIVRDEDTLDALHTAIEREGACGLWDVILSCDLEDGSVGITLSCADSTPIAAVTRAVLAVRSALHRTLIDVPRYPIRRITAEGVGLIQEHVQYTECYTPDEFDRGLAMLTEENA